MSRRKFIENKGEYLKFIFSDYRMGYELEDYSPLMTPYHFRMRDLIYFFNRLHKAADGFQGIREADTKAGLRKKALATFIFFLLFLLPFLFSLQLLWTGKLGSRLTTISLLAIFAASIIALEFLVIDYNNTKMERKIEVIQFARELKIWLLEENYYWVFKKYVVFDIDRNLNIYLVFLEQHDIIIDYKITRERLNNIRLENQNWREYEDFPQKNNFKEFGSERVRDDQTSYMTSKQELSPSIRSKADNSNIWNMMESKYSKEKSIGMSSPYKKANLTPQISPSRSYLASERRSPIQKEASIHPYQQDDEMYYNTNLQLYDEY